MSFTSYVAWSRHCTSPSLNVLLLQTGMTIVPNPWHCGNKIRSSWYVVCHWPALGRQACKWINYSRVWTKEASAEKGARSLRSRELLKCGSHSQGDGKGDGGQRACQSFHQDLVPKYYVNGNTSRNFTKWHKDNKQTNKQKYLIHCHLGSWPSSLFFCGCTQMSMCVQVCLFPLQRG